MNILKVRRRGLRFGELELCFFEKGLETDFLTFKNLKKNEIKVEKFYLHHKNFSINPIRKIGCKYWMFVIWGV